ncbi:hypothetical protein [Marivita sp. S2033]|uniref:hypothetical protein n=1 Tax=Marivita sp. S2033 TaxID=3373187 RepID=UPI0039825496
MAHFSDDYPPEANPVGQLFRRIIGVACLIAVPGTWIAVHGALPEARIMGLAMSVVLMGFAGLCLLRR